MKTLHSRVLSELLTITLLIAALAFALPGAAPAEDEGEAADAAAVEEEAPPAPEMIENPYYARWAAFAPGSFVTLHMETELPGGGSMENRSKIVLKSVTETEVVLETLTISLVNGEEIAGQPVAQRHAAQVVRSPASDPALQNVVEEGTDTLTIGGEEFEATWRTIRTENEAGVSTTTTWEVAALPGGMAKARTVAEGVANVTSTATVVEFEAK